MPSITAPGNKRPGPTAPFIITRALLTRIASIVAIVIYFRSHSGTGSGIPIDRSRLKCSPPICSRNRTGTSSSAIIKPLLLRKRSPWTFVHGEVSVKERLNSTVRHNTLDCIRLPHPIGMQSHPTNSGSSIELGPRPQIIQTFLSGPVHRFVVYGPAKTSSLGRRRGAGILNPARAFVSRATVTMPSPPTHFFNSSASRRRSRSSSHMSINGE